MSSRRRRRAPSEPALTSPLPHTPSPLECDVCGSDGVCSNNENSHLHTQQHTHNLCHFLRVHWRVAHPEALLKRYGPEVIHQAAERLFDMDAEGDADEIRSRGGFAVWLIGELATPDASQTQPRSKPARLRVVGDSHHEDVRGGGG